MGILVTLSGLDGAGKTTVSHRLMDFLVASEKRAIRMECGHLRSWTLWEQLSNVQSRRFRATDGDKIGTALNLERLAFVMDHVLPATKIYDVVILERYLLDWAAVGQAFDAGQGEIDLIRAMSQVIDCPARMFYLKISAQTAATRVLRRGKSTDIREAIEMLAKQEVQYTRLSSELFHDQIITIDASTEVSRIIPNIISNL